MDSRLRGKDGCGRPAAAALHRQGVISYNPIALLGSEKNPARNRPTEIPKERKPVLSFRKKAIYYGLMLFLTLLALEGMARLAYYAAYGTGYGGGVAAGPDNLTPPPPLVNQGLEATPESPLLKRHPIYGYIRGLPYHHLPDAMLPRPRREDTVVIALLGGSVAYGVNAYLERALGRWFAVNSQPRRLLFLNWAAGGVSQPQQTMLVAGALLRGGAVDLIINLDGVNEIGKETNPTGVGAFPFFPGQWKGLVGLTAEELLLIGQIGILRREQTRRAAAGETSILRRSALFGLLNRYQQESNAAQIIRLNHELATAKSAYRLEKHGPRRWWAAEGELQRAAARLWYRSSLMLNRLAAGAGADYYHFLQPNQYAPPTKPLSPWERANAYEPDGPIGTAMAQGYPLLTGFNQDLQRQGVNYFDLTGIFVDHSETLYLDSCCHLNDRGNELLAAKMVQRMEPALRRWAGERPAGPVSPLAAAGRRPAETGRPAAPDFQVSLAAAGKGLRYVREDCAAADTAPRFFLHLVPRAAADRPSPSLEQGSDNRVFSFAEVGGRRARGQCAAQIPLPDYPIAALRTGQYIPDQGDLWSTELIIPANPDKLRADYAALSVEQPVVRDYFDLYMPDNRLIYLRETCAAADTAANFFLHIIPEDAADLPADRRDAGFAHGGFAFDRQGGHFDGKCLATVELPDYPIKEIRTGQHIPGQGNLWSVELIAAPDPDKLRADYAALSAANPAARDYFDLYWRDNRLLYLREACVAADMAANFFLHIVPENPTDLPAERQAAGFAYGGFAFAQQGGHFDGKCLAAVTLPDYPGGIKEMRTGQFVPGQGDLWSVELMAAP